MQPHTTDDDVLAKLQIPSIETLLKAARLRYVARVWKHAPQHLKTLLHHLEGSGDGDWLYRIRQDFAWLQERSNRVKHFPDPWVDDQRWWELVQSHEWNGLVTRTCAADTVFQHYMARYRVWRKTFQANLVDAGLRFHDTSTPSSDVNVGRFACGQCDKTFHTNRALSVHLYKVHNTHANVRSYISDTVCGSCLKDFHSLQRLRQHLQYKQEEDRCLKHLQSIWHPHAPIDLDRKQELKTAHRLPAIRRYGPCLPTRQQWSQAKPTKILPIDLRELADPTLHGLDDPQESTQDQDLQQPPHINWQLVEELVAIVLNAEDPFQPPQWQQIFDPQNFQAIVSFGTILQEELIETVDPQLYAQIHPWYEETVALHFQQQRSDRCPAERDRDLRAAQPRATPREQPLWEADSHRAFSGPTVMAIPRLACFGTTHYLLYAYSGHRRSGDLIEWMDHYRQVYQVDIQVLTIDIVYDAELCDLQAPRAQKLWLELVQQGRFIGMLGAPPCET